MRLWQHLKPGGPAAKDPASEAVRREREEEWR